MKRNQERLCQWVLMCCIGIALFSSTLACRYCQRTAVVPVLPISTTTVVAEDSVPIYSSPSSSSSFETVVHFDFNSYKLKDMPPISDIVLEAGWYILIEGHCDERGSAAYNYKLGMKRAEAMRDFFVAKGVDKDSILVISYGKAFPINEAHTEEAWALNRRAVVNVLSSTAPTTK